jgi:hypothetical protein
MRCIIVLALVATALMGVCAVPAQNHVLQPMVVDSPLNFMQASDTVLAPNDKADAAAAAAVNPTPAPAPAAAAATPAPAAAAPAAPKTTPAVPVTPLATNVVGAAAAAAAPAKSTPSGPGTPTTTQAKDPAISQNKNLVGDGDHENQLSSPPKSEENKGPNVVVKAVTIPRKKDGEHLPMATAFGEAPATTLSDGQVDAVARLVLKGARKSKCNGEAPYCDMHISHKPAAVKKEAEKEAPKKEGAAPKKDATPKPEAEKPAEPKKEEPKKADKPAAAGNNKAASAGMLAKADELLAKAHDAAKAAVEKVVNGSADAKDAKPEENKDAKDAKDAKPEENKDTKDTKDAKDKKE